MDARNGLIRCNLRYVVDVARRYRSRGLGLAELDGGGWRTLMDIVEQLNLTRERVRQIRRPALAAATWHPRYGAALSALREESELF